MQKFICSKCHSEYFITQDKVEWDKYCGDRDLFMKYGAFQFMYKGKLFSEPYEICAIYRDGNEIQVNSWKGGNQRIEKKIINDIGKIAYLKSLRGSHILFLKRKQFNGD